MDLGLQGKRALVLAAGGGLGSAVATALVGEGAHVMLTDWYKGSLAQVEADLRALASSRVEARLCDLSATDDVEALAEAAISTFGGIDILVNITGGPPSGPLSAVDPDTWRGQFSGMVLSVMHLTNALVPGMRERKWGRVLTCTSSGVLQPIAGLGISNTLRASLVTWSKTLANEVAADNVTVNVLVPGRIHTKRVDELDRAAAERHGKPIEDIVSQSLATIPMGRYGRPDEFASVAAFIVSERASYITGSVIRVDGGMVKGI